MYVLYILECSCIDRIPRADVLLEGEEEASHPTQPLPDVGSWPVVSSWWRVCRKYSHM